jgi:mannosyltransferase
MSKSALIEPSDVRPDSAAQVAPAPHERHFAWHWLTLAAVLALAAGLRFHAIAARSLWFDEGFSLGIARLDWWNFAQIIVRREANMVLYYLLLRGWLLFGHNEAFVRGLSALAGIGAVAAVYGLGRRLFNSHVGWTAALLLSVNALHVHYSQEARSYALVVLLVTLSSASLIAAVQERSPRSWTWYTVWSILAVYAHFFALLVVAAQWTSLLWLRRAGDSTRDSAAERDLVDWPQFFTAARMFGYAMVPVVACGLKLGDSPIAWVPPLTLAGDWTTLVEFAGAHDLPASIALVSMALLALGLTAAGVATWRACHSQERSAAWPLILLWCWLVIPFAVVIAASVFRPMLLARFMIICLPPLVLLVAAGFDSMPLTPRIAAVAGAVALAVLATVNSYSAPLKGHDDWRAASQFVFANAAPNDGAYFYTGQGRAAFDYYRWVADRPADAPTVICPAHPEPWRDLIPEPLAEILPTVSTDHPRVWLVLNQYITRAGNPDIGSLAVRGWLVRQKHYSLVFEKHFDGIEVALYVK